MLYETELTADEAIALATSPKHRSNKLSGSSGAAQYMGGDSAPDHRSNRGGWAGGSFDEAVDRVQNGWREGRYQLKRKLATLPAAIRESIRPRPVWGPSGSSVDIGRFIAGEPDSMIDVTRQRRQSLVLRIGVERAVSSDTHTEDIVAVGASVLAVVERLRTAGIASEVWVTFTQGARNNYQDCYQLRVKVQEAGRPIDIDRLAFWCMDPMALRRIAFAVEEMEPEDIRHKFGFKALGHYGYPERRKAEFFDEYAPALGHEVEAWIQGVLNRRA